MLTSTVSRYLGRWVLDIYSLMNYNPKPSCEESKHCPKPTWGNLKRKGDAPKRLPINGAAIRDDADDMEGNEKEG